MNDKDQCCGQEMSPEEEKAACAEEILAAKDCGMDLQQAEKVLTDESASEDEKDAADSVLAAADSSGLNQNSAEESVAQCESTKQGNQPAMKNEAA